MYGTRALRLLFIAIVVLCLAQATFAKPSQDIVKRQDEETGDPTDGDLIPSLIDNPEETSSAPAEETTTEAEESTSSEEVPPETTSEAPPEETSSSTTTEENSTPPAPTSTSSSEDAPSTTSSDDTPVETSTSSDAADPTTTDSDDDSDSTSVEPIVSTSFETVTRTREDGTVETSTSATETTTTPEVNDDGSDGGGSGMSDKTRNTIIGVVVGIGGAALLGGLAVVFWRIRSRRKAAEEHDSLMESYDGGYAGAAGVEAKSDAGAPSTVGGSARSPFQSTLENYHQPAAPVNASSNF